MMRAHLSRGGHRGYCRCCGCGLGYVSEGRGGSTGCRNRPSPDASLATAVSPMTFAVVLASSDFSSVQVEVSSRADLDPDGSLANAYRVGDQRAGVPQPLDGSPAHPASMASATLNGRSPNCCRGMPRAPLIRARVLHTNTLDVEF
jgi:hypothetical protein